MSDNATYTIYTTGKVLEGFDSDKVVVSLSDTFGVSLEQALAYVGKKRLIKKEVNKKVAHLYVKKLQAIGLHTLAIENKVEIEPVTAPSLDALALVPVAKPDAGDAGTQTVEQKDTAPLTKQTATADTMSSTEKATKHDNNFSHTAPNTPTSKPALATASSSHSSTKSTAVDRAQPTRSRQALPVAVESDTLLNKLTSFALPLAATVVTAVLWWLVGKFTGYEFSIVACGVGWVIAMACIYGGGSGVVHGAVCAGLVIVAVMMGKYLYINDEIGDLSSFAEMDSDESIEMWAEGYAEMKADAEFYLKTVHVDSDIPQFMVERDYSYEDSASDISSTDIADFKTFNVPDLEKFNAIQPTLTEWVESVTSDIKSDFSVWAMVKENMDFMSWLFILFGMGVAFRMVSEHEPEGDDEHSWDNSDHDSSQTSTEASNSEQTQIKIAA